MTITDEQILALKPGQHLRCGTVYIERGSPAEWMKTDADGKLTTSKRYTEGTVVCIHDWYLLSQIVPGLFQYLQNCLDAEAVAKGYVVS